MSTLILLIKVISEKKKLIFEKTYLSRQHIALVLQIDNAHGDRRVVSQQCC